MPEDPIDDDYEDDFDDDEWEMDPVVRAKWMIDGAKTFEEAAQMARHFSDWLQEQHDKGYKFRHPVEDDYGFYYHPDKGHVYD